MIDTILNDEDVNISDKTKVSCAFEKGFKYKEDNNSFIPGSTY